jgi:hypothetical protein
MLIGANGDSVDAWSRTRFPDTLAELCRLPLWARYGNSGGKHQPPDSQMPFA